MIEEYEIYTGYDLDSEEFKEKFMSIEEFEKELKSCDYNIQRWGYPTKYNQYGSYYEFNETESFYLSEEYDKDYLKDILNTNLNDITEEDIEKIRELAKFFEYETLTDSITRDVEKLNIFQLVQYKDEEPTLVKFAYSEENENTKQTLLNKEFVIREKAERFLRYVKEDYPLKVKELEEQVETYEQYYEQLFDLADEAEEYLSNKNSNKLKI